MKKHSVIKGRASIIINLNTITELEMINRTHEDPKIVNAEI